MLDGQLAGHWRRSATRSRVDVDVLPLRPFAPAEVHALEREAARYGDFVGAASCALRLVQAGG